jgi:GAF domain-containing protein
LEQCWTSTGCTSKSWTIAAHTGFEPEFLRTFAVIDPNDENHSICTRAILRRHRVLTFDVTHDTEFPVDRQSATSADFRSVQSTPVFSSSGKLLAVVSTHWVEPHHPTTHQEAAMDAFLRQAAHFLERRTADDVRDDALAEERFARRVAEDLVRGKDQFITAVVHELRGVGLQERRE